jgi:hypothetical protein
MEAGGLERLLDMPMLRRQNGISRMHAYTHTLHKNTITHILTSLQHTFQVPIWKQEVWEDGSTWQDGKVVEPNS